MIRILSMLQQRLNPESNPTDAPSITQDGCWKQAMNPKATDMMGNVYPLPEPPQRKLYQNNDAPAAELHGREYLW
ncbi:MAG: hypothetical protein HQL73_08260 [Magnetococcales bacterium]|nr:hypothetical protein [Magnetococcales bacterium]